MNQIEEFRKELKELLKKYNVTIHESSEYNGGGIFMGNEYYFKFEGKVYYNEEIVDFINR